MKSIELLRGVVDKGKRKAYGSTAGYYKAVEEAIREIELEHEAEWMKLPLDCYGEPIHVGDEMIRPDYEIRTVAGVSPAGFFYVESGKPEFSSAKWGSHIKPRTVEDVLDELSGMRGDHADYEDVVNRCAELSDELRNLLGVG